MTMQNQQNPYLFWIREKDRQDPNNPDKMLTFEGTGGIETSYGATAQEAQDKLFQRLYANAQPGQDWDVRSEGIDPLFAYRQSVSNNFSPSNPYFSGSGAGQYNYTPRYATSAPTQTGNPFFDALSQGQSNYLQNFQRSQTTNPRTTNMYQGLTPFTPVNNEATTFQNLPSDYNAPQYTMNTGAQAMQEANPWQMQSLGMELPSTFDTPMNRQYGGSPGYMGGEVVQDPNQINPYLTVSSAPSMDPRTWVPPGEGIDDMFPMRGGGEDTSYEMTAGTARTADVLRDAINDVLGIGGFMGAWERFTGDNVRHNRAYESLRQLGIEPEALQSNDPQDLLNIMQTIQGSNAFAQTTAKEIWTGTNFGVNERAILNRQEEIQSKFSPYLDQTIPNLIQEHGAREGEVIEGADVAGATDAAQTTTTGYTEITPGMINEAMRAVRDVQAGNPDAMLSDEIIQEALIRPDGIAADIFAQWREAQERVMPFGRELGQRTEMIDEYAQVTKFERQIERDILQSEIQRQTALDTAGISAASADYRTAIDFAGTQMQIQSQERTVNAQLRSSEAIAMAGNQSQEYIAELQANTTFDVAKMNNMTQEQVALINSRTTLEAAEITGMTQRDVANIKGQYEEAIALATNLSREEVQRLQNDSAREVTTIQANSAQNVATLNNLASISIAEDSNATQSEIARLQTEATKAVAEDNNSTELEIARLIYSTDATALRGLELEEQKTIMGLQQQYAKELAALGAAEGIQTTEEAILKATNQSQEDLQKAQLEYEKTKYEYETTAAVTAEQLLATERQTIRTEQTQAATTARTQALEDAATLRTQQLADIQAEYARSDQLLTAQQQREDDLREVEQTYQETLRQAEQDYQDLVREDIQTFEGQQATGAQGAQMNIERLRVLGGYANPQEFQTAQLELSRGGLTQEESVSLQALLARGGLTAEERLSEIQSETRSAEMNSLLALLSNPQALGAFVTIISGELPFTSVPTMGELTDMTPSRIEYLQGALSALGIDPQTFIRMAQDVTPQAFQETGPFGQLSAMIA